MAKFIDKIKATVDWVNGLRRLYAGPLDKDTLYTSESAIDEYIQSDGSSAWVGQTIVEACRCQSDTIGKDTCACNTHDTLAQGSTCPTDWCAPYSCECHGYSACPDDAYLDPSKNCGCQSQKWVCRAQSSGSVCACDEYNSWCEGETSCDIDSCECNVQHSTCTCQSKIIPGSCACYGECTVDDITCPSNTCECNTYRQGCNIDTICAVNNTCNTDTCVDTETCTVDSHTVLWQITDENTKEEVGVGTITDDDIYKIIYGCPEETDPCSPDMHTCGCHSQSYDPDCPSHIAKTCGADAPGCLSQCACDTYSADPCPEYTSECTTFDRCDTDVDCPGYDICLGECTADNICTINIDSYKPIEGDILAMTIPHGYISYDYSRGSTCRTDICGSDTRECSQYCGADNSAWCACDSHVSCKRY